MRYHHLRQGYRLVVDGIFIAATMRRCAKCEAHEIAENNS